MALEPDPFPSPRPTPRPLKFGRQKSGDVDTMNSTVSSKSYKRIIIACDGTWTNSDNGFVRKSWLPWNTQGTLAVPSNVTRLCRALLPESTDGIQQVVYYQGGVGSANTFWSFFGGYFGEGISENIREAYSFICNVETLPSLVLIKHAYPRTTLTRIRRIMKTAMRSF